MTVLRPKYQLDKAKIEGDRYTINAKAFSELTGRRFPYPRLGTRAPNQMFPHTSNLGHNPGLGHGIVRTPYGYTEIPPTVQVGAMKPRYTLDRPSIEGIMPASIYREMTGKLTTEPTLPPIPVGQRLSARGRTPVGAPALVDWGSVFWGAVAGGTIALGLAYGLIPALAEWGVKAIRKRG